MTWVYVLTDTGLYILFLARLLFFPILSLIIRRKGKGLQRLPPHMFMIIRCLYKSALKTFVTKGEGHTHFTR